MQKSIAKSLRIVFMGTPYFAVECLKLLIENSYNIVGIVTAPDKPSGRGQKIKSSAVKQYAEKQGLTILQPSNLKSEEFGKQLSALYPELHVVVAFRMLPKSVWNLPKYGTFNLHASQLPDYRGAAPIHWAIINGESETGVTTFLIDEKIDTGSILLQERMAISKIETVGTLHDKLMILGAKLIIKTIDGIASGALSPVPQSMTTPIKTAYKLNRNNCKIDWKRSVIDLYNQIRGLNPFPAAWCYLVDDTTKDMIKVFECTYSIEEHGLVEGNIIERPDHIKVAAKDGFIEIYEIQLPGKRKMDVKSLLNGYHFKPQHKLL